MAQGCHLIYSASDRKNFPVDQNSPNRAAMLEEFKKAYYGLLVASPTIEKGVFNLNLRLDEEKAYKWGVSRVQIEKFKTRFSTLTADDKDFIADLAAVRTDRQAALIKGLGNAWMSDDFAGQVSGALSAILKKHPAAMGLFEAASPGASPWIDDIENTADNKASGCAWEVIATAKLMSHPAHGLQVYDTDRLTFGWKAEAHSGSGHSEADLLIRRPLGAFSFGWDTISVDFQYGVGKQSLASTRLEGVATALRTGQVTTAHFVCNSGFKDDTKLEVNRLNIELRDLGVGPIELHESYL